MLGYYNYTVIATYASLLSSVLGILQAWNGNSLHAILCLMLSGFLDAFDGKIASTKRNRSDNERRFGIQIDSLCDVVCFGVLPAAICRSFGAQGWLMLPACLFVLCALIRLAYFNVQEEERQSQTKARRSFYNGMPVTTVSLLLPPVYLLHLVSPTALQWGGAGVLLVCAILFISPIRFPKPHGAMLFLPVVLGAAELLLIFLLG